MAYVFPKLETAKDVARQMFKSALQKDLSEATWKTGPNTVEISTTAPLSYLLIIVNAIQLE